MVCPILISVSVTPGALAALAAQVRDAIHAAAPALDCGSERRDNITFDAFPRMFGRPATHGWHCEFRRDLRNLNLIARAPQTTVSGFVQKPGS
jgi:hypothetical protein